MGVEKTTLNRNQRKHHLRMSRNGPMRRLMAVLGCVQKSRDGAEDEDEPGAQKPEDEDENDRHDGQDEGVFDQSLALFARTPAGDEAGKLFEKK
jgi:hypothetical protein